MQNKNGIRRCGTILYIVGLEYAGLLTVTGDQDIAGTNARWIMAVFARGIGDCLTLPIDRKAGCVGFIRIEVDPDIVTVAHEQNI